MKYYYRIIVILVMALSLQACSREPRVEGGHVVTVQPHASANTLFYSGTIQPIRTLVVTTAADGAVVEMPFQYGEKVEAGQLLFLISSSKFLTDYKSALLQYIKAKSEFNTGQTQLSESTFLHKNKLISDDEYKMKQSSYYAAQLGLLQAKDTLQNLLQQLDIKDVNLYSLTIADIDKITQRMQEVSSENLRVISPASGVILAASKSEDETKKVMKGDVVKQGDVLAVIGDMTGLSVRIKVNELTVNQLASGQKVKVTGIAFPDDTLNGNILRVERQGESTGGGLPTFTVEVVVPKLTLAQQKIIHAGMSAKVEIDIEEEPQIMIPITAVTEKNGDSFVTVYDEKIDKTREVLVKTGKTTIDSVAIISGLKAGDKIVVPN